MSDALYRLMYQLNTWSVTQFFRVSFQSECNAHSLHVYTRKRKIRKYSSFVLHIFNALSKQEGKQTISQSRLNESRLCVVAQPLAVGPRLLKAIPAETQWG